MAELVSYPLRYTLKEYCVFYFSVRMIENIFYDFGIQSGELDKSEREQFSSSRRCMVESFYKAFGWSSILDVRRLACVSSGGTNPRYDLEEGFVFGKNRRYVENGTPCDVQRSLLDDCVPGTPH